MRILFHCPWHNSKEWLDTIKKRFKSNKIYTLKDKPDLSKIECAIIWNVSNYILSKMNNVKVLFSLGAGVDHIIDLKSYCGQPIIRLKDSFMAERMTNHIFSQILFYQLKLKSFQEAQLKNKWIIKYQEPALNSNMIIGILGVGYFGFFVAKQLSTKNDRGSTLTPPCRRRRPLGPEEFEGGSSAD